MYQSKWLKLVTLVLAGLASQLAHATMVQQMNLGELTNNADKIFRGTVMSVESGKIIAGGSELATTKYIIRVTDTLKGNTTSPNGKAGNRVELTMLGSLKTLSTSDGPRRASLFKPPALKSGEEYLLFTTRPSRVGLSTTVGIGQGTFRFIQGENVLNDAKNAGLFKNMDRSGLPQRGPVPYSEIVRRIYSILSNQGG